MEAAQKAQECFPPAFGLGFPRGRNVAKCPSGTSYPVVFGFYHALWSHSVNALGWGPAPWMQWGCVCVPPQGTGASP